MSQKREDGRIWMEGYSFSEAELEWASKNMDYLGSFLRGNRLQSAMLLVTFVIGLGLYAVAQLINSDVIAASPVIADFLYNLGITLWTSVVLAFLLEVLVERQRQFTERYMRLVQEAMRRKDQPAPVIKADDSPDSGPDDSSVGPISQQLSLLLELKSEVAALRAQLGQLGNKPV